MITWLKDWKGGVEINGTLYENYSAIPSDLIATDSMVIVLHGSQNASETKRSEAIDDSNDTEYVITVKLYMTKPSTPEFDFMSRWNHDNPMPLRTMVGTKVKETRGMVYMKLHGDIVSDQVQFCMKCGKPITNPVSKFFGMGPECGGHNYVNPFNTREELEEAVNAYRKKLNDVTWEGWIIRSAITSWEEYKR